MLDERAEGDERADVNEPMGSGRYLLLLGSSRQADYIYSNTRPDPISGASPAGVDGFRRILLDSDRQLRRGVWDSLAHNLSALINTVMNRKKLILWILPVIVLLGAGLFFYLREPGSPVALVIAEDAPYPLALWVNGEPLIRELKRTEFKAPHTLVLTGFPLKSGHNKVEMRSSQGIMGLRGLLTVRRNEYPDYPEIPLSSSGEFKVKLPHGTPDSGSRALDSVHYDEAAIISAAHRIVTALAKTDRALVDEIFVGNSGASLFAPGVFRADREWTRREVAPLSALKVVRGKYLVMVYAEPIKGEDEEIVAIPLIDLDSKSMALQIPSLSFHYVSDQRFALYVSVSAPEKLRKLAEIK